MLTGNALKIGQNALYTPDTGYVLVPLPSLSLEPIEYDGEFMPKAELHCSVVNIARLAVGNAVVGLRLLRAARRFLSERPLKFTGFTGEVYGCSASYERRSILGLIGMQGMDDLYDDFRKVVPDLPDPVPHATTHTRGTSFGLAVPNAAVLAERCTPLPDDVAAIWHKQVGYKAAA